MNMRKGLLLWKILLAVGLCTGCGGEDGPGIPDPPASVAVSAGVYTDKVSVYWLPSEDATGYEVWRADMNNPAAATKVADIVGTGTTWDDTSTAALDRNWYFVRAVSPDGISGFSAGSEGWRAAPPAPVPAPTPAPNTPPSGSASVRVINNFYLTQTIYIDEVVVGTVSPGSRQTFTVSSGTHRIRAWDSTTGSLSETFTVRNGDVYEFTIFAVAHSRARDGQTKTAELTSAREDDVASDD